MLAFRSRDNYLDQIFVAPSHQAKGVGKMLLDFTRSRLPDEIWLRTATANVKAASWYEREGFVLERHEPHPTLPDQTMSYYRWKRAS